MAIKALCDYYNILNENGKLIPDGRSEVGITYAIDLSADGEIVRIRSVKESRTETGKNGKEKIIIAGKKRIFPKRVEKTAIYANVVEHRPLYIFGMSFDGDKFIVTDKANKSHADFRQKNIEFFTGLTSRLAVAFFKFVSNWIPENETANSHLSEIKDDYESSKFEFCLDGYPNDCLQLDSQVLEKFDNLESDKESETSETAQCAIMGERLPIATLHDAIRGIANGQPSGCKLVCVNNDSEESYGYSQGGNAKISETAMKQYCAALNYLIKNDSHHTVIGDMTVVHWAMDKQESQYNDLLNLILGNSKITADDMNKNIKSVLAQIHSGKKPDFSALNLDGNVKYYVLGMTPNSSRIAVKFFYTDTFGNIMTNVLKYHDDFALKVGDAAPPLYIISKELVSPVANGNPPSDFTVKMMQAMLSGGMFPRVALETIVRRVKTDSDTEKNKHIKFNNTRIGIIKAYLNRKNKTEVITMSLNNDNKDPAYLAGRLFALLEAVQQKAAGDKLNKTIRDSYFSSACSTPATVFPRLLQLAQNHLSKIDGGLSVFYDKKIQSIMADFPDSFPKTLSLEEQGEFIIGYYQQKEDLFKGNKEADNG